MRWPSSLLPLDTLCSFFLSNDKQSFYDKEHHQCSQHGTAAIADKRQCDTGHRDKFRSSAHCQEHLENIGDAQSESDQLVELVLKPDGNIHKHDKTADTD